MMPTLSIRRVQGKPGSVSGAFTVRTGVTAQGETHRPVYLGTERSSCHVEACKKRGGACVHIEAAKRLVESERASGRPALVASELAQ